MNNHLKCEILEILRENDITILEDLGEKIKCRKNGIGDDEIIIHLKTDKRKLTKSEVQFINEYLKNPRHHYWIITNKYDLLDELGLL